MTKYNMTVKDKEKKIVAHINIINLNFKERLNLLVGVFTGSVGVNIYKTTMRKLGFIKRKL